MPCRTRARCSSSRTSRPAEERPHRAVGVVHHPSPERWGNFVPTVLGRRNDAFCWFDESRALTPLHDVHPSGAEMETYPDAD
jgi:erythromycin esterase